MIQADYARLPTEKPNPKSRGLDTKTSDQIVRLINAEDARVALAVRKEAPRIAAAARAIARSLRRGGRLVFVGAGTSGRLGVLEAAECPPTFNTGPGRIKAVMAGGRSSVFKSREGAEDDAKAGAKAVKDSRSNDVVIGIAASGVTPFVRGALAQAGRRGSCTILVTSSKKPRDVPARIVIAPAVGPEVIAGSTRMKSGTAAKMVLNMLTTTAMVLSGKVYDQWMVDLKPSSFKLKLRALRLITNLGRVAPRRAEALIAKAGGNAKTAILMARKNLSPRVARQRLAQANGSLRRALVP